MIAIDKLTFKSPINIDNGVTLVPQGEYESEMELYQGEGRDFEGPIFSIEWICYELGIVEHIGIEWIIDISGKKVVTGYDGVFELPEQAIELLEKNGFNCDELKD